VLVGGIFGYFFIPSALKRKYVGYGLLGLILGGLVSHEQLIERIEETYIGLTDPEAELDGSALKRIDIARANFQMALDHPLGAGHRTTAVMSPEYMDPSLLGRRTGVRAAHNTSGAVVAEHGFPGIVIYFLTILWVLRTMWRMKSLDSDVDTSTLQAFGALAASALVATYVSGNFSNNIDLETQYWCLALLASAYELQKAASRAAERQQVRASGPLSTVATNPLIVRREPHQKTELLP
jgi:O-antigen ligase